MPSIKVESTDNLDLAVPKKMNVAYLQKPLEVSVEQEDVPAVSGREVLVKVMAVGICGSDVHYYAHGRIGNRLVTYPHIQGHECAGIVVATGDKVTRFKVGDRVAVEPGVACMSCSWCKEGRYNLCPDVQFLSTPPVKGAFVQFLKHPEEFLFPIPESLSFEHASLAEPLSVAIHAVNRGKLKPGSTVVITGMGPVGLMTVVAAKAYGAKEIIVTDMEPLRLETAQKLGATQVIDISSTDTIKEIMQVTSGLGADLVFETSGNVRALQSTIEMVKPGGSIVTIGFPNTEEVPLNVTLMLQKEIDLFSVYRYTNTYPLAINILVDLGSQIEPIITDRYSLEQINEAMYQAYANRSNSLKVIVFPN